MNSKYDLNVTYPINAVYSEPLLSVDKGIKFIEALPDKMTDEEISQFYYDRFPIKPSIDAKPYLQEEEIHLLEDLRLPLEPVYELESTFLKILKVSYRNRSSILIQSDESIIVKDSPNVQTESIDTMTKGDGHTGSSLLGIGGCGKTCSISRMLERYPQTLIHNTSGGTTIQIVWLYVQPSSNSDLSVLMDSIGDAIDRALCNKTPVYGRYIRALKKLGQKSDKVAQLFRLFNVGVLIIDEIQRFNTFINKNESFEVILTMINKSKTGLLVCGTEDAYEKFLKKYYILRRMGKPIRASRYCNDYEYFSNLAKMVMSVQWFRQPQAITDDIIQALYMETSGIIERLIAIWESVQLVYIRLSEQEKQGFKLTPEFITKCASDENPLLSIYARQTLEADLLSNDGLIGEEDRKKGKAVMKSLDNLKASENPFLAQTIFTRVKKNLTEAGEKYPDDLVLNTATRIVRLKSSKDKTEDELIEKAIKEVRKHKDKAISASAMNKNVVARTSEITELNLSCF